MRLCTLQVTSHYAPKRGTLAGAGASASASLPPGPGARVPKDGEEIPFEGTPVSVAMLVRGRVRKTTPQSPQPSPKTSKLPPKTSKLPPIHPELPQIPTLTHSSKGPPAPKRRNHKGGIHGILSKARQRWPTVWLPTMKQRVT